MSSLRKNHHPLETTNPRKHTFYRCKTIPYKNTIPLLVVAYVGLYPRGKRHLELSARARSRDSEIGRAHV